VTDVTYIPINIS